MNKRTIVVITGLSGSGKSFTIKVLEDVGFYCVDNLPLPLFPKFLELIENSAGEIGDKIVLGADVREGHMLSLFPDFLNLLRASRHRSLIIFLEASEDVLIRRFNESRRPHPLSPFSSVLNGIRKEKSGMAEIRGKADLVIDTSKMNVHELKALILKEFQSLAAKKPLTVNIVSFGFALGLPPEASLVFDVRFLPNPHFVPSIKHLTGKNKSIKKYIFDHEISRKYLKRLLDFIEFMLPCFQSEGKSYVTIAVGCTGGRHRSVAVAEMISSKLKKTENIVVNLTHRDL